MARALLAEVNDGRQDRFARQEDRMHVIRIMADLQVDDIEQAKGFYTGCGGIAGCIDYKVVIDDTVFYYGHQSLKMQYVGEGAVQK